MVERKNSSRPVIASLQNLPVTPRKVRLVVDLIRHLPIPTALNVLENVPKRSAPMILKLLNSAVANATNNFGYNFNNLEIQEIYVNEGRKLKRFRPKAKGATAPL
ncbi:MAG: 50S ribosomal protein L22 [Mollicutes bacterium]|nr:MAG: 50S ribosomal protein L22 [Mollicutes bacterium]